VLAVTTALLPENFMLARTKVRTAAPIVATISLQALMRHQYQRRMSTAPVPAPMPRTIVHPVEIETSWLETHPLARTSTTVKSLRSEEHTSELQSRVDLVCRLLLEKKKSIT